MKYLKLFEAFNNQEFIWIHGLPGSGKSHLSNKMSMENLDKSYVVLDDIANIDDILEQMNENRNIILTSPYFENYNNYGLDKKLKNILDNSNYLIKEYWFENNPKACVENVSKRQSHNIGSTALIPEIWYYSKNYKIPTDAETISVWQGE
jgi:uridine kinase